jgi:xylan 1,4-beta-xylosidase
VHLPNGEYWSVFLGNRPYEGWLTNLGRETFMLPVDWRGEWPAILAKGRAVPQVLRRPKLNAKSDTISWSKWRDEFGAETLGPEWLMRRAPVHDWLDLRSNKGSLNLGGDGKPSFVGRRQQHADATVETALRVSGLAQGKRAGLVAIADEQHQYFFGLDGARLIVAVRDAETDRVLAEAPLTPPANEKIRLRITAKGAAYEFSYATDNSKWQTFLADADGRVLATEHDGLLFTGTIIGLYAGPSSH